MKATVLTLISLALFSLIGCSTGHCRREGGEVLKKVELAPPKGYKNENMGSIRVAKPDGSLQCGMRAGISLDDMANKELQGVSIISAEKRSDGLMRIQSCGAATGMLNTFEIKHQDLMKAQKAGFTVLKEQPQQMDL